MSRSRKRQHGQALIMFVLALVVILAFTSIVIDLGLLRTNTARLQNALDAGALAGAQQLPANHTDATAPNGVEATVTRFVTANYPSPQGLTITYYCLVPATIVDPITGLVTDQTQLNILCPSFRTGVKFACYGTTCDALCGSSALPTPAPVTESCDMIGVTAYDTQPFSFGSVVGVPKGTINGSGGGSGNPVSYAANLPSLTPVDVALIVDRTGSMSGTDTQNAQAAAEGVVRKTTYGGKTFGPYFDPAVQWLAFGMLGPSQTKNGCKTYPAGSGGSGGHNDGPANVNNPSDVGRWFPIGLSGQGAQTPGASYNMAQDATYNAALAAIQCYTNSGVGTDLADPVAMATKVLDTFGHTGHRQGIVLETDGQANEYDTYGAYSSNTPCANLVAAAGAAKIDKTISPDGIEIFTIGFGLDGTNNTGSGNLCSESGTWSNKTPRSALVASASAPAADNPCTAPPAPQPGQPIDYSSENTPIYYNSATSTYVYVSSTPLAALNPASMTRVATAPSAPWEKVTDHFFCVPKSNNQTTDLSQVFAAVANSLASGSHLIQLPVQPPVINSIAPSHGSLTLPTTVVITGKYFTSAYAVTPATSYVVNSDTQITAVMPSHTAGTVNVTVTNPSGASNAVTFTYP